MILNFYECGCLYAQGRNPDCPAPEPRCEVHGTKLAHQVEKYTGALGLNKQTGRYLWMSDYHPALRHIEESGRITHCGTKITFMDGTMADGAKLRSVGGRETLWIPT